MNENMMNNNPPMNAQASQSQSNRLAVVGIIAVVAVVAFIIMQALANNADNPTIQTNTIPQEEVMTDHENMPSVTPVEGAVEEIVSEDSAVSLTVEGGSFYYRPNVITVQKGATVTITLESVDMMHDFVIDELGVQSEIVPAGESTTVTFVADEAGEFEFYCSVGNHRQMGMVGTLVVEE